MQFKVPAPLNNPLKVCVSSPDWLGYQSLVFKVSYGLSTLFGEKGTSDTLRGVTSTLSLNEYAIRVKLPPLMLILVLQRY